MLPEMEQLAAEAGIEVLYHASSSLIHFKDAPRLLDVCVGKDVFIAGIDGFCWADQKSLVPDMKMIGDFSELDSLPWRQRCVESVEASRRYVENVNLYLQDGNDPSKYYLEFVLIGRSE